MNQGLHHISIRKRIFKNLETYPHPEKGKRLFDEFIYVVSIVGPFVILPQVIEIWVNKNIQGVSVVTWGLSGVISSFWFVYGVLHKEKPIMFANALGCILSFLVVLGILVNH